MDSIPAPLHSFNNINNPPKEYITTSIHFKHYNDNTKNTARIMREKYTGIKRPTKNNKNSNKNNSNNNNSNKNNSNNYNSNDDDNNNNFNDQDYYFGVFYLYL